MTKLANVEINQLFDGYALLKSAEIRKDKTGKNYLALVFQDDSGSIEGKLWDVSQEDIAIYQAGTVVYLKAKREVYQGRAQLKIILMRPLNEDETFSPADFVESAPLAKEELQVEIESYIQQIDQPIWQQIVRSLYEKYQTAFLTYPAAKRNHHAFYSGLAYHVLTMLHLAESLSREYPMINRSLLYAGVILHDLGKVIELTGPNTTEYTLEGNLVGHLVLIDGEIVSFCHETQIDPNSEEVVLLRHMVLAHHGLLEYGSPVRPRILEAEVLHQIDHFDATMQMMDKALQHTTKGQYTERIFGLDNRSFYKPKI